MKALIATGFGTPAKMGIEERDKPLPKQGFSVVRMHAATVNPLSHLVRSGQVEQASAPRVLSNDGSGIVESGTCFAPGTAVVIYGAGQLGITQDGLQQQWVLVEDKRLFALPDGIDLDTGAALPINYVTAYQALTRVGQVKAGQSVLVSGASGSVGQALIQLINALGATPIAVVSNLAKVERARAAGARVVLTAGPQDLRQAVLDKTAGRGVDLALDPVGGAMLGAMVAALRPRGTLVSIGFVAGAAAQLDVADLVVHEKRVLGYDAWLETDADVAAALSTVITLAADGVVRPCIDSVFPLGQYQAAYERLNSRQATGSILLHL